MAGSTHRCTAGLVVVFVLFAVPSDAQPSASSRYVAVKGGVNIERAEDGLAGSSGGAGAAVGVSFAPDWMVEVEVWVPVFTTQGSPDFGYRHRDILASGAAIRSFHSGHVRPFAVLGLGVGRTQQRFTSCMAFRPDMISGQVLPTIVSCSEPDVVTREAERFDSFSPFFLTGAGARIPLTRRVTLVPEGRVHFWITSVIARLSLGVQVGF